MMEGLRAIAKNSKFNVTVFNPYFVFFDQFVLVRTLSIQAILLAAFVMMLVSFVFIPNHWCSMWVAFSIVSIEVGVVGYMTMWGVSLDSISMINLIMCIGFSVDFSAHISYAYLTAKADTPDERVKECLFTLGLPIVQGGLSTIFGVIVLTQAPSYIFVTFFKIVFLVIFFGIMHGIFLLPVLLSLVGPGSSKPSKGKELPLYDPEGIFMQKEEREKQVSLSDEANSHTRTGSKKSPPSDKLALKSGAFLASAVPKHSGKYLEHNEKDMGIGTSGEESGEGSLHDTEENQSERGPSVVEVSDGRKRGSESTLPIKEMYSNNGYISENEESRDHPTQPQRRTKRRNQHQPSRSAVRNKHQHSVYANETFHNK
ncbi:UNVERIFIED_CONTAM: hypothetical protein GTU68_044369 [Idotea baltica]|nr:hypothetical protein [Idotea baltica]